MKQVITPAYVFSPAQRTLDLSAVPNFTVSRLYAIINVTSNAFIYAASLAGYGIASRAGGVLTFAADTTAMHAADDLIIIYDDPTPANVGLLQGGAALSPTNRLPVEIDADTVTLTLPAGLAQDTSIQTAIAALNTLISDVASNHADLQAVHVDTGTTLHADLGAVGAKLAALVNGRMPVDGSAVTQPMSAASLPLPAGASTEATLAGVARDATVAKDSSLATLHTDLGLVAKDASLGALAQDATVAKDSSLATLHADLQAANTTLGNIYAQGQDTNPLDVAGAVLGPVNETVPASDTASSGLNGRLQRVAQNLSSILAKLTSGIITTVVDGGNATLGSKADAVATSASTSGSLVSWTRGLFAQALLSSTALGTPADAAATGAATSGSVISYLRGLLAATLAPILDMRATGQTLSAATLNGAYTLQVNGQGAVGFSITGLAASGATLTFESTNDSGASPQWSSLNTIAAGALTPTITADGNYRVNAGGHVAVRARVSVAGTGSITIASNVSAVPGVTAVLSPVALGPSTAAIGTVGLATGTSVGLATGAKIGIQVAGADISPANPLAIYDFTPIPKTTIGVNVGTTATQAGGLALPATTGATSYRVRNPINSASPVAWILTTDNTKVATLATLYSTSGTGGSVGDKMIDPGGVEVIGLTAAQITALAAGTLFLSAICPTGSATLYITPGNGT